MTHNTKSILHKTLSCHGISREPSVSVELLIVHVIRNFFKNKGGNLREEREGTLRKILNILIQTKAKTTHTFRINSVLRVKFLTKGS